MLTPLSYFYRNAICHGLYPAVDVLSCPFLNKSLLKKSLGQQAWKTNLFSLPYHIELSLAPRMQYLHNAGCSPYGILKHLAISNFIIVLKKTTRL